MTVEKKAVLEKSIFLQRVTSVVWLVLLAGGMALFMGYENRAGTAAEAPGDWPRASQIPRVTDRSTLVMLLHPHCPCTRATINELARLITKVGGRLAVRVVFVKPDGVENGWEQSDIWASAAQIPGVQVVNDEKGRESLLFGARTSGQSMLYNENGKLVFSGGITVGRGEEGDSMGAAAIVALIGGQTEPVRATSVFGCPLFSGDPNCLRGEEP
jgi:hypothetical protein